MLLWDAQCHTCIPFKVAYVRPKTHPSYFVISKQQSFTPQHSPEKTNLKTPAGVISLIRKHYCSTFITQNLQTESNKRQF